MPARRPTLLAAAGVLLASLAACAETGAGAPPAGNDIAFMRGCWISRQPADGPNPQTITVRLLPSRTGAPRLEGELLVYNQQPGYPPISRPLAIDLDGRHAARGPDTFAAAPSPIFLALPDKGWARATFATSPPKTDPDAMASDTTEIRWLIADGDGDHLRLASGVSQGLVSGAVIDFDGARDGCD